MIRIKPRRCGYGGEKGYTCQRLPQLQDWMFNEEIPFIAQMKAEFNKLPLRVKGMVYTEETIDMGWSEFGPHPEVPELTCRSNTDPASDMTDVSVWGATGIPVEVGNATAYPVYGGSSGWLDLFNSGYEITGGTQYFYHNVSGTAAATSDVYIKVTGVDHEYHDIYLVGNIPTFKNGEQEMEMGPGLLEPMLDTDFAPVGIDTIPAWEAGLDADIFTNIVLNAWKGVIDDRIQNIYARLNTLPAYDTDQKLRDLTAAENKDSECDNFQISLESGSPVRDPDDVDAGKYHAATLPNADNTSTPITAGSKWHSRTVTAVWQDAENIWWWTVEDDPNQYTISGGDIAYGDNTISVVGLSGLYAPFYAYLMPSLDVTITHADVVAADVPTVVDGGTTRMITDGDVLPSGGTVTGFTSSGSGAATRYAWETVGDNTAEIRTKTGSQLSEEGTADPEPGGIGIGGVRIIQSAAESDPLILYKIYHEDCIAGIEKPEAAADAATAGWLRLSPVFPYEEELMNVEIPSGTEGVDPTVIGATAGIVQPVHNIQIHGSTEYRTQSPVDVPTVEAVYNFIHNYDDFADGEFEQASALATGSTMYTDGSSVAIYTKEVTGYTGSLAVPGTAIVATDIKTILVEGRTVTASGCVPTAQAVVDYIGDLTFDGVGSTVGIIGYTTNVPETLWPIPGSTVDPATGYVQNVQNIYVGSTHSVSAYAVPTVDAVYHFIHGTTVEGMTFSSALATAGTMSYHAVEGTTVTGAEQGVYEVVENIVTLDENGSVSVIGNTTAQGYVPEAQAVVDWTSAFVSGYTAASGTMSLSGDPLAEGIAGDKAGITTVARNIVVNSDDTKRAKSPYAVPTVEAVYEFIHGTSTYAGIGILETASALATIGGMTATVSGVTADNYVPGTMNVVGELVGYTDSLGTVSSVDDVVPTADAVVKYVKDQIPQIPKSISGVLVLEGDTERWYEDDIPTPGIVSVSREIHVSVDSRTISLQAVPSLSAVVDYVAGYTASIGSFTVSGSDAEDWTKSGSPVVENKAVPGIFSVVDVVAAATVTAHRTLSTNTVPTVAAVKDYVDLHVPGMAVSGNLDSNGNWTGVSASTVSPGIFYVTGNVVQGTVGSYAYNSVPTTHAVWFYVNTLLVNAVAGEMTGDEEGETIDGAISGFVGVARNIWLNVEVAGRSISSTVVPTVEAVYNFIRGNTNYYGDTTFDTIDARATVGGTTASGSSILVDGCTQGVFDVVGNIDTVTIADVVQSATSAVPTADAVAKYVKAVVDPIAVASSTAGTLIRGSTTEEWSSSDVAVEGTVKVAKVIVVGATPSLSLEVVPSVQAVYSYLHNATTDISSGKRALAVARKINAPSTGTKAIYSSGATPGTCYVCTDMEGLRGSTVTLETAYVIDGVTYLLACVVPTVAAVKDYVAGSTVTIGTFTATANAETWGNPTAVAGLVNVVDTVTASTNNRTISTTSVPTVAAVKDYVDQHVSPSTYTGPFAVKANATSGWDIQGGRAYFGTTSFVYNGDTGEDGSEGDTFWVTFVKGSTGTVGTANLTGVTAASFPIARIESGKPVQLQYGDITIMGRWM